MRLRSRLKIAVLHGGYEIPSQHHSPLNKSPSSTWRRRWHEPNGVGCSGSCLSPRIGLTEIAPKLRVQSDTLVPEGHSLGSELGATFLSIRPEHPPPETRPIAATYQIPVIADAGHRGADLRHVASSPSQCPGA